MGMFLRLCFIVMAVTDIYGQRPKFGRNWHLQTTEAYVDFTSEVILSPLFRSPIECTAACDRMTWCGAIIWDQELKTCKGLEWSHSQTPLAPTVLHLYVVCKGEGYIYEAGICFRFYDSTQTDWSGAQSFCEEQGGRAAVLDTDAKLGYVSSVALNIYQGYKWWLGAKKDEISYKWSWSTGQAVTSQVKTNSPTNAFCLELCLGILDDIQCWSTRHVLCEL